MLPTPCHLWRVAAALFLAIAAATVAVEQPQSRPAAWDAHESSNAYAGPRNDAQGSAASGRHLLQKSTSAAAGLSNATIFQAADVTFRLLGSDALPFTNKTLAEFQHSLNSVFSNYSSASFQYQSATVSNAVAATCKTHQAFAVSLCLDLGLALSSLCAGCQWH